MLSDKMQEALNEQINWELFSAYLYLAMAAEFETRNLPGFAHWMKLQAKEETSHAMRFFSYINDRGGRVVLKGIGCPPSTYDSPLAMFEHALLHERAVTERILRLSALADEEKDVASRIELDWFVKEQVEEEKTADEIVQQLKLIGASGPSLLIIDRHLGART
jgi:ferritin